MGRPVNYKATAVAEAMAAENGAGNEQEAA